MKGSCYWCLGGVRIELRLSACKASTLSPIVVSLTLGPDLEMGIIDLTLEGRKCYASQRTDDCSQLWPEGPSL